MGGLCFGNGVALSPKEDFVLVADIGRFRIWKHDLKSATTEVFADFQGAPDNLKSTPKSTFMVGFPYVEVGPNAGTFDMVKSSPMVARTLARLVTMAKLTLDFADTLVPHDFLKTASHHIAHCEHNIMAALKAGADEHYVMIAELDQEGKVVNSWHSPNGPLNHISEGYHHTDGYIYLGSPYNTYVARVKYEEEA